ncbi:pepF/M3 family oligoendopeptidase [Scopulibacillus daqui]|uniref:PepF/M3 family oligoendopeptidase n=1 Tax=Scopulibacillus daqui TaxID=1469162 RepID=A0ABS2PYR7_9BACL|nr:M3 family oligoendopeptidase [Scopulibacillus daqui]MBM7645198.1 pepF/M3 family oligoendopeptidase [Scopulibacillus daqui]
MEKTLSQTWDLDTIFEGGSHSEYLNQFMDELENDLKALKTQLSKTSAPKTIEEPKNWKSYLHLLQSTSERIIEARAFIECLIAQNVKDQQAKVLNSAVTSLLAQFETCNTLIDSQMNNISDDIWTALLADSDLRDIAFSLNERRRNAQDKLSTREEQLVNALSIDGYHGWSDMYDTIVGSMTIPFDHPEKGSLKLSVGQANNLLSDPNRDIRKNAFKSLEKAWDEQAELSASVLNHLAGFRLNLYEQRGWSDVLKEPLNDNRMSKETLSVMWETINRFKPVFVKFLQRKAEYLGLEKLSWFDLEAPLSTSDKKIPYEEAAAFIIQHFNKFNPKMAEFAKSAIENRWIEAEDRPGKAPGGFCTSFPITKESRIFLTYSGSADNVSTIAHELGHAYHQHVMNGLPHFAQQYAMNVAETASTFAEMIVSDAAKQSAQTEEERLSFLDEKASRSVALLMNIHARFLFETKFYEERKKGLVSAERLNKLMLNAQKEAYCDALDVYHPAFWQSKLHFYITDVPFYNFPYTFGYLFSTGIYVKAREEGSAFAQKYDDLLRDTGRMTVEDLAKKHLNIDLTQPDFWRSALDYCAKDVEEFLAATEK